MELLQLKYFADAAKTENFSKTARRHLIPPSAVSGSVKKLETELGAELFHRSGNRIALSESGKRFYEGVDAALQALEYAKQALRDGASGELEGEVSLLVLTNRRTVTDAISAFRGQHPGVDFLLTHELSMLEDGNYDLCVSDRPPLSAGFPPPAGFPSPADSGFLLVREGIRLAVAKEHPLARKSSVLVPELAGERFVSMPQGSSLHRLLTELCGQAGFRPRIAICCDDPYYIRRYVQMNLGAALFPEYSWRGMFDDSVVFRPILPAAPERSTYLHIRGRGYLSRAAAEFAGFLKDAFHSG